MAHEDHDPLQNPELKVGNWLGELIGYTASTVLISLAFALTYAQALSGTMLEAVLTLIALLVIGLQLVLFTNQNISQTQRWKTVATVLTIPLLIMLIGLTAWMFYTYSLRTGLPPLGH